MEGSGDWTREEVIRLRDWRHNVVAPALIALSMQVEQLRKEVAELRPRVEAMARADEIADAVAEHMRANRRGLLTTGEKLGGLAVGVAAIVSVVAPYLH